MNCYEMLQRNMTFSIFLTPYALNKSRLIFIVVLD